MHQNIGPRDLAIRALLVIALATAAFAWAADLGRSAPAAIGAVWLAGTVLTRRCPLYCLLGLSTGRRAPARTRLTGPHL